jgi:hypothetical protein
MPDKQIKRFSNCAYEIDPKLFIFFTELASLRTPKVSTQTNLDFESNLEPLHIS